MFHPSQPRCRRADDVKSCESLKGSKCMLYKSEYVCACPLSTPYSEAEHQCIRKSGKSDYDNISYRLINLYVTCEPILDLCM